MYKVISVICLTFILFLLSSTSINARSGCCSWHGGVCGCGCCDGTAFSSTCAPYYSWCDDDEDNGENKEDEITYESRYDYPNIPFESIIKFDPKEYEGYRDVRQRGVDGKKKRTFKETYINGVKTSEKIIRIETTQEPISEVIVKGTKEKSTPSSSRPTTVAGWISNYTGMNEELVYPLLTFLSFSLIGGSILFINNKKKS